MRWDDYYKCMLALTMWREAQDQGRDGMRAVGHVIRNRVNAGWGDYDHVITKKWQFSSLTAPGDPMLVKWPDSPNAEFEVAMAIAEDIYSGVDSDITMGATMYANLALCSPVWAEPALLTVKIGAHTFFKDSLRAKT